MEPTEAVVMVETFLFDYLEQREGFLDEAFAEEVYNDDESEWPLMLAMVAKSPKGPAIAVMFTVPEALESESLLRDRWVDECARATRAALPEVAAIFHLSCGSTGRREPWITYHRGLRP